MPRGPSKPPYGARTCEITSWHRAEGTFWQLGADVGMIWKVMPDWGEEMMVGVFPCMQWTYVKEIYAEQHFNLLSSHF